MATTEEIKAARDDAKLNLLRAIASDTSPGARSKTVLRLAEAYAWLESPSQPHGAIIQTD